MARGYLVAGNWKMNGSSATNAALLEGLVRGVAECPAIDVLVCPPSVYLEAAHRHLAASPIALGAQNLERSGQAGGVYWRSRCGDVE